MRNNGLSALSILRSYVSNIKIKALQGRLRQTCFYLALFSILFFFNSKISYSGEWCGTSLEAEIKMYKNVGNIYEKAQGGSPIKSFGLRIDDHGAGFDAPRCWSEENRIKLAGLLKKMISDERLHEMTIATAIKHYIRIQEFDKQFAIESIRNKIKPSNSLDIQKSLLNSYIRVQVFDDFILNILTSSEGEIKQFILQTINNKSYNLYSISKDFLKKSLKQIEDDELKHNILKAIAKNESFDSFIKFCQQNYIEIPDEIIKMFKSLQAIDYLLIKYGRENIDYQNLDKNKEYFRFSKYILYVLANNLHRSFPNSYLERMTSEDLRYLRNGIFATYGKNFRSKLLQYYFYGLYANVQKFCRNGKCGSMDVKKRKYKSSDLTDIDRLNIKSIQSIETIRLESGYKENNFVENYDLDKFLKDEADNFVISSPKIRELKHFKMDWERNEVWIWDKNGVSGWNLKTGIRFRFIKGAKGPIGYSKRRRLLAYQFNGNLILEDIQKNNILFTEKLERPYINKPNLTINKFSESEDYFIFISKNRRNTLSVYDINTKFRKDINLDNSYFYYESYHYPSSSFIFADQDNYILAFITQGKGPFAHVVGRTWQYVVIPVKSNKGIRYIDVDPELRFSTMALGSEGKYLYIHPRNHQIYKYELSNIVSADTKLPPPVSKIIPDVRIGMVYSLNISDNLLFRSDSSRVDLIDLNDQNSKAYRLTPYLINSLDLSKKDKIIAYGNNYGFIVFYSYKDLPIN